MKIFSLTHWVLFCSLAVHVCYSTEQISAGQIRDCITKKIGDKRYRKKTENERFAFHYGQLSVEVFNAVSQLEIKQLNYLNSCLLEQDRSYFWNRHNLANQWMHYGGSNVTYLTGLLQEVFPSIELKLYEAMSLAVQEAGWEHRITPDFVGIRSIEYLYCKGDDRVKTKKELEAQAIAREEEKERLKTVFVIGGSPPTPASEIPPLQQNHDEAVVEYMNTTPYTVITAYLVLTDPDNYQGGDILIEKLYVHGVQSKAAKDEGEDVYDDEDEEEMGVEDKELEQQQPQHNSNPAIYIPKKKILALRGGDDPSTQVAPAPDEPVLLHEVPKAPSPPKFDALKTKIDRYSPEKGGIIFVLGDAKHGMRPVSHGVWEGLKIQFWNYAHAELSRGVPSLDDAKPMPMNTKGYRREL